MCGRGVVLDLLDMSLPPAFRQAKTAPLPFLRADPLGRRRPARGENPPTFKRSTKRKFIGVFEIAPDR